MKFFKAKYYWQCLLAVYNIVTSSISCKLYMDQERHQIIIVGGGSAGLELATTLGRKLHLMMNWSIWLRHVGVISAIAWDA